MSCNLQMHSLDVSTARTIFEKAQHNSTVKNPILTSSDLSEIHAAYASGTLDPALSLLLGTQCALKGDTDSAMFLSDALAGAMLEKETPAQMSMTALADTLAVIDTLETGTTIINSPMQLASNALDEILALPEPLRGLAIDAVGGKGWQKTAPGIQRLTLDTGSHAEAEIYRIEGGKAVPRHTHEGSEFTLVISGGFTDETGSYGPGDLSVKGPEDTHQPVADAGEVCFTLAVRDGGLKFTGWMGVVQKLVG